MHKERGKRMIIENKLAEDFDNKKISKEKYIKLSIETQKNFLNSKANLKFVQCSLDNCYDLTKTYIDMIANKKENKYNTDHYNNIMLLNYATSVKDGFK